MRTRRQSTAYWRARIRGAPASTLVDIVIADLALQRAGPSRETIRVAKRRKQMEHLRAALPGLWLYVSPWIDQALESR